MRHSRRRPTPHSFSYRVYMLYFDLAELPGALDHRLLWSARRPALARFRRSDYPGRPDQPLDAWVRELVAERTGERPSGPIRLLTTLRSAGYWFNPISVYYCYADDGATLRWVVAEVTSTPWRERHHYVLDARTTDRVVSGEMDKELHVSPFLPMALRYRWKLTRPGAALGLSLAVVDGEGVILDTGVALHRRPICTRVLAGLVLRYPPMSLRVLTGIYGQALRLWRKHTPYHPHAAATAAGSDRLAA